MLKDETPKSVEPEAPRANDVEKTAAPPGRLAAAGPKPSERDRPLLMEKGKASDLPPGKPDVPNPEPEPEERKGPLVKLYGTAQHGDAVTVHGMVGNERRTMRMHRQELERHGGDLQARREWVAGLLASAPQDEPVIDDPWEIRGHVRLP